MNKFVYYLATTCATLAVFFANFGAGINCIGLNYEPDMPEILKR
jgi:cyclic lactone autoinducer peptide